MPHVIKADGKREAYDEEKLRGGMLRALEKRPVDANAVDAAIHRVEHRLKTHGDREVPSRLIGEWVMHELSDLDQVAYVRFASVYRSFQDVDEFNEEIKRLQNQAAADLKKKQMSFLPGDE